MKLKSIIFDTALFATGVLASNRLKHELMALRANEHIPYVTVRYTGDGAYVNGEKVYADRIGAPRCDWDSIEAGMREQYSLSELQKNDRVLADYLRDSPGEDRMRFVYFALVQMARRAGSTVGTEADSLRQYIGSRWDVPQKR